MYHMYKILSYLHINGKHENGFCALKGCCSGVIGYACRGLGYKTDLEPNVPIKSLYI